MEIPMEWVHDSEPTCTRKSSQSCKEQRKRGPHFWTHFKPLFQCAILALEDDVIPEYCAYKRKFLIPWHNLPISVSPSGGGVPKSRCWRKLIQVENMMIPVMFMMNYLLLQRRSSQKDSNRKLRVVEFCSGSGFIGLPLAVLFPSVEFVLVDMKVLFYSFRSILRTVKSPPFDPLFPEYLVKIVRYCKGENKTSPHKKCPTPRGYDRRF